MHKGKIKAKSVHCPGDTERLSFIHVKRGGEASLIDSVTTTCPVWLLLKPLPWIWTSAFLENRELETLWEFFVFWSLSKCSQAAIQPWTAAAGSSYSSDVQHLYGDSQAAFAQLLSWHSYHCHY